MISILRFLPDAEDDIIAGYAWYESKAKGLGEEFLRLFYAGAAGLKENPLYTFLSSVSGRTAKQLIISIRAIQQYWITAFAGTTPLNSCQKVV